MRRAARTDQNHSEIVMALRRVGCRVLDLSRVGNGAPDLLVSLPQRGRTPELMLMEVKTARGKLNARQRSFEADGWPVFVVRSIEDALKLVGVS